METKTKVLAIGGAVVAGVIVVAARFLPGKEVEIIGLYYFDGTTWIGLSGAVFEPAETVVFGGKCKNKSSVPLNVVIAFRLIGPDDYMAQETFTDTLAPNEEVTYPYSALLGIAGEYTLTVTVYEEETMAELVSKTVSFQARPKGEVILSDLVAWPSQVEVGDKVFAQVTATNTSNEPIEITVTFTNSDPGLSDRSTTIIVPANDLKKPIVYWQAANEGTWEVTTEDMSASYEVVPAPVCTIGETKCIGVDLYTCQLVDPLTPGWELLTPNSSLCGYVPPLATGTVLDVLVDVDGHWVDITGREYDVGQTIRIGVFWKSDMAVGGPDVIGDVYLKVIGPAGNVTYPTAVRGNNQRLGPGENSAAVEFDITPDKAEAWVLTGGGAVNFA